MRMLVFLSVLALIALGLFVQEKEKYNKALRNEFKTQFGVEYSTDRAGRVAAQTAVKHRLIVLRESMKTFGSSIVEAENEFAKLSDADAVFMTDQLREMGAAFSNASYIATLAGFGQEAKTLGYTMPQCGCICGL